MKKEEILKLFEEYAGSTYGKEEAVYDTEWDKVAEIIVKNCNLQSVSGSLPTEYSDLLNAAKKAYVAIRHEKNPSNTQLEAYFDIEKAVKAIEGNYR